MLFPQQAVHTVLNLSKRDTQHALGEDRETTNSRRAAQRHTTSSVLLHPTHGKKQHCPRGMGPALWSHATTGFSAEHLIAIVVLLTGGALHIRAIRAGDLNSPQLACARRCTRRVSEG